MSEHGLKVWHSDPDAEVDIVFVHGLRGGRETTWAKNQVIWPRDLLPKDVEKSRIIGFGYDSGVVHSNTAEVTQGSLESDARSLCSQLKVLRNENNSTERPIITVAHSLGGLVCAQIIVSGHRAAAGHDIGDIARRIKGMIFLGTPFGGSSAAKWGELVRRVWKVLKKTDGNTLQTLIADSHDLKTLRDAFPDVVKKRNESNDSSEKIGVVFFFERLPTYGNQIVEERDASYRGVGEIIPIVTNHLDICKYASDEDVHYKVVKAKIIELMQSKTTVQDHPFGDQYNTYVYGGKIATFLPGGTIHMGDQNITM